MFIIEFFAKGSTARIFSTVRMFFLGIFCALSISYTMPVYAYDEPDSVAQAWYDEAELLSDKGQDKEAFALYLKAAERGHAPAQGALPWIYNQGRGVEQDNAQALLWARKGAEQGDGSAQMFLGSVYVLGSEELHIPKDEVKALFWYKEAVLQGEKDALEYVWNVRSIGKNYYHQAESLYANKQYKEAFPLYLQAAKLDVVEAQAAVAWLYNQGFANITAEPVEHKDVQALYWADLAAEQGSPSGMRYLAAGYAIKGVYDKALELYTKAAEKGDAEAMRYVAMFYGEGLGVAKDTAKQDFWLTKMAEQKKAEAKSQ